MAYKRYVKRGNKLCGPYYYESYRDKYGKVQKRYVGTENPSIKKPGFIKRVSSVVPTLKRDKKQSMNLSYFLFILILIVIVLGGLFFVSSHINLTNFVVYDSSDSQVSNESVVQTFDTPQTDLNIIEPAKLNGQAINSNKNKRMDFDTTQGKIRLYFDLLNYSEFVLDAAQEVGVNESVVPTNITIEENVTEPSLNETNNITEETNTTLNITIPETNLTNESNITIPETDVINETVLNETIENETNPIINNTNPDDETINESDNSTTITGNVIRFFAYTFRSAESIFRIGGKVIDETNDTSSDENNDSSNSVSLQEINITDVSDKVNELDNSEVDKIADNSVIPAENFEINVNKSESDLNGSAPNYKWGYKVKLKDLKFMAKIDVHLT